MDYVIEARAAPSLPVAGTEGRFPVRRIYLVGRNYADHAREMGHDPEREEPFFFQKNPDSLVTGGGDFPYPPRSDDVHHEVELVVALASGGHDIPLEQALERVYGYAVGLDMTRRDLQAECKKRGRPWEIGKAFEHSAPCGEIVPANQIGHPDRGAIWLKVNGELRQDGDLSQVIWGVGETISFISRSMRLAEGDLIMTGTPAGVGKLVKGDEIRVAVEGLGEIANRIV